MLVGHTPQRAGINSAADGQIWRVDTGMTSMMGGPREVRVEDRNKSACGLRCFMKDTFS